MSSEIEEKVLSMKFDSAQFLNGIQSSLKGLGELNKALAKQEAAKGLTNVTAASQGTASSLKNVEAAAQAVESRFKAVGVIGASILNNLTNQAVFAGQRIAKSLTIESALQGFREYETNMNSIQTILSNTQAAGTNLRDVTGALDELNRYSDQTIYNFAEMAKNIGTFTAAGVDLKTATGSIKGIANLAALSGTNSERAAGAMYQLSQAISSGKVSLMDWNSVVNAGMGGSVFQRALAQTAVQMGKLDSSALKLSGSMKNVKINGQSFRDSISADNGESWLTSDVLTKTLQQFTGDMKDAELAAMGFSKAQIASIQKQAKMAKDAATQVKTFSQLIGTIKESSGSGWAKSWQLLLGDFEEAKVLFTSINNVIGTYIEKSAESRNELITHWKALGGRQALIDGFANSFKALGAVLSPIGKAFRQVFPKTTANELYILTVRFREFTENLMISGTTANQIQRIFAGVFSVFRLAGNIIGNVASTIGGFVGRLFEGSGGFLEFAASIGDWLVQVEKAGVQAGLLNRVFDKIEAGLNKVADVISKVGGFLGSLGIAFYKAGEPMNEVPEKTESAWTKLLKFLGKAELFFLKFGYKLADAFRGMGNTISEIMRDVDWEDVFAGINTGIFASIALMIRNFIGGGGIVEAIENFGDTLGALQNTLRATTLLQIAAAVLLLAIAMDRLSKIDAGGLTRASAAIGALMVELMGAMAVFSKIPVVNLGAVTVLAANMILLSAAILILSKAVETLAKLSWEDLAKGLGATAILLGMLVATVRLLGSPKKIMNTGIGLLAISGAFRSLVGSVKLLAIVMKDLSKMSWTELAKGLLGVGAAVVLLGGFMVAVSKVKMGMGKGLGIIMIAAAVKLLASAVKDFANMDWATLSRGFAGLSAGLGAFFLVLKFLPANIFANATGILIVAAAMKVMASAVKDFANMDWATMGRGLAGMAAGLGAIFLVLKFLPKGALLNAAAVFIAAAALKIMASALDQIGSMDMGNLAQGLIGMAAALGIIGVALKFMQTSIAGALALIIVSGALAVLAGVLMMLGSMSLGSLVIALVALAGGLTIIGLAAVYLGPLAPALWAVTGALLAFGAGIALVGLGVFLFAAGVALLGAALVSGSAAIVAFFSMLIGLIPLIIQQLGVAIVILIRIIGEAAPEIGKTFKALLLAALDMLKAVLPEFLDFLKTLLLKLLEVIKEIAPKLIDTLVHVLTLLVEAIVDFVPRLVDAGLRLITGLLNGIANNIGKIVTAATRVITAFMNSLGDNIPKIADSGAKMVIKLVNGIADAIRNNSRAMGEAGANLGRAILEGMANALRGGLGVIRDAAMDVARTALNAAKDFLGINSPSKEFIKIGKFVIEGFRKGLDGNKESIYKAFNDLKKMLKDFNKEANDDIVALQKKLKEQQRKGAKKSDIAKTKKALAQAKKEEKASELAYKTLTKNLNDETSALGKLADKYDTVTAKLEAARKTLEDATKTRDDYNKQISDQYSDMASADGETKLADYVADLKKQIEDTKTFSNSIQRLRALGLNDEMYKDLLATGPSSLPFIQELLAAGKSGVDEINKLGAELDSVGGSLGKTASTALYQAGVDAAAGLVKGLEKQQAAIEAQMDKIADAMVKSIKKKLGIKSPSRVFAEVGGWSAQGLARGLDQNAAVVAKSSEALAGTAVTSLQKSLSNMDKMVVGNMDMNPTIRPVLDLTDVQKKAAKIGSLLPSKNLTVDGSYSAAVSTSAAMRTSQELASVEATAEPVAPISFTQNNYSPKALTNVEIYRQTKNQLSTVRGARGPNAR